ncbi:TSUP family transporter [Galbibacter sp.]|uniref:TSUP family transporter n=1 Tax=Galbibacter sp. TaxID=2918471 RepID=UPI003A8D45AC
MDYTLLFCLATGIFAGFYVQTVVGFAGTLVSLPLLLLAMPLPDAIAYVSIFYFFSSVSLVFKEWKNIDKQVILKITTATIIGIIVGVLVLRFSKPLVLKRALGVFIILYVLYVATGRWKLKLNNVGTAGFGAMAGFFSGVFSTGGPLYVICVENSTSSIRVFRATMIGIFGLVTLVRVPALAVSGILNFSHLKTSLLILPVFLLAQYMGKLTFKNINEGLFKKSLLCLLCISALGMFF